MYFKRQSLALAVLLAVQPAWVAPALAHTIYLSGAQGTEAAAQLRNAQDGDVLFLQENITLSRGTGLFSLNKKITIESAGRTLTFDGYDGLSLENEITFKDLTLAINPPVKSLSNAFANVHSGAEAVDSFIFANGNQITFDNVSTKVPNANEKTRPIIVLGAAEGKPHAGKAAVIVTNASTQTKFNAIIVGSPFDENSEEPAQITLGSNTSVDKIILGSGSEKPYHGKVNIVSESNRATNFETSSNPTNDVSITLKNVTSAGAGILQLASVNNLTLEGNSQVNVNNLTVSGKLTLKEGSKLTAKPSLSYYDDDEPVTLAVKDFEGAGGELVLEDNKLNISGTMAGTVQISGKQNNIHLPERYRLKSNTNGNFIAEPTTNSPPPALTPPAPQPDVTPKLETDNNVPPSSEATPAEPSVPPTAQVNPTEDGVTESGETANNTPENRTESSNDAVSPNIESGSTDNANTSDEVKAAEPSEAIPSEPSVPPTAQANPTEDGVTESGETANNTPENRTESPNDSVNPNTESGTVADNGNNSSNSTASDPSTNAPLAMPSESPILKGTLPQRLLAQLQSPSRTLFDKIQCVNSNNETLWVGLSERHGKQKASADQGSVRDRNREISLGVETQFNHCNRLGIALSHSHADFNAGRAGKAEAHSWQIFGYGSVQLGQAVMHGYLGAGRSTIDSHHALRNANAKAHYHGSLWQAGAAIGYPLQFAAGTLTPRAELNYGTFRHGAYREQAGTERIQVAAGQAQSLILRGSAKFETALSDRLAAKVEVGVGKELLTPQAVHFSQNGKASGHSRGEAYRLIGHLGVGLSYRLGENSQLAVGYHLEQRKAYQAHQGRVEIRVAF